MKTTRLPDATRENMLAQNGLSFSARWSGVEKYGHGPDDSAEQQDGERFTHPNTPGYVPQDDPTDDDLVAERVLGQLGFVLEGGWTPVSIKGGAREGGITSHRGVIHPDEYVDHERLVALIEQGLGFTFDDIHAVYRQGPLSSTQRELRGRIDARLLALSRSGGNMSLLGRLIGWAPEEDGTASSIMRRALARARAVEEEAA